MMLRPTRFALIVLLVASAAACSSGPSGGPAPSAASERDGEDDGQGPKSDDLQQAQGQEGQGGGEPQPIDQPASGDNGTSTTPANDTEWTGTVSATNFFPFGPDGCRFAARFENVVVNLSLRGDKVARATITAKDVEKIIGACGYDPKPTPRAAADHTWSLPTADGTMSTVTIKGDGLSDLSVEVGLGNDGTAWASLTWNRVGVGDPWSWTVGPQWINLTKK